MLGGWELVFPSVSVCWFYPVGRVWTFSSFSGWGFGFLGHYAGRFCILCPISFIFVFLGFLNPKAKWVLISEFFQNLSFSPRFACRSVFSSLLGTWWFVNLGDPFGYQSNYFCFFCCIGMRVASVLPSSFSVEWLYVFVFIQSLCWSSWWWCATHVYICQVTWGARSSVVFSEVVSIGVGLGVCMPTGTHRWMSMGMVG